MTCSTLFQYIDSIKLAPYVDVIHIDSETDARALTDKHFEQAGFVRLLK